MKQTLIIGAYGNLGHQLSQLLPNAIQWDRDSIDITNREEVIQKIANLTNLGLIINCAAYNDLDTAEDAPDIAFKLNTEAPGYLAEAALIHDAIFVHYSTGYVFSGTNQTGHTEIETPDPNSVYAQSKFNGEEVVKKSGVKHYIIRTNVLFGPKAPSPVAKPSVVDTLKNVGEQKHHLKCITDELSNFTFTPDLAHKTLDLIKDNKPFGIYHLTNEGYGSWYDLAREIFTIQGWGILDEGTTPQENQIVIEKIVSADYPRKAKRPKSAVLVNTKTEKLRPWQEALREHLLNNNSHLS